MSKAHKEFNVGYHAFFRVKLKLNSLKLGSCAKLAPIYCGPFKILEHIGLVAYKLALLTDIREHKVFHVSLLKKYVRDPYHMFELIHDSSGSIWRVSKRALLHPQREIDCTLGLNN